MGGGDEQGQPPSTATSSPWPPGTAAPNLAEPEPRRVPQPLRPRRVPASGAGGRRPRHPAMGQPLLCPSRGCHSPSPPALCPPPRRRGSPSAAGWAQVMPGGRGGTAGAASPGGFPSVLSRFGRKWRWGERERRRGSGERKRWTYLGEFCAHQDEEAEGQQLACRLHLSHPVLGTSHTDHLRASLPCAVPEPGCLLTPLFLLIF